MGFKLLDNVPQETLIDTAHRLLEHHVFFAVVDPSGLLGNGASGYTHIKAVTDCEDDLTNSFATKRRSYILDFDAQDRRLEVLFCIRLVNRKDQDGPWGPVFSAIVP
ncbi:hypothetical protein FACS1894137_09360 [Spirochaetia bacterium]|nr:hypothetical protein FACS1894137_09360 [Spirochaetia bacterium]